MRNVFKYLIIGSVIGSVILISNYFNSPDNTASIKAFNTSNKEDDIPNSSLTASDTDTNPKGLHNVTEEHYSVIEDDSADPFKNGEWLGYSKELNAKLDSKDPRVMPSIDEYPEAERNKLKADLAKQKKLGFIETDHDFMKREMGIKNNLYGNGAPINTSFELSNIPTELSLYYVGYTMEDAPPTVPASFKSNVIRRVFNVNGVQISLEESSATNGTSHFTKEFVTNYIGEYPALLATLRKDNYQFEQLVWNTDTYRYALYGMGNKPIPEIRKQLLELANQITILNKAK